MLVKAAIFQSPSVFMCPPSHRTDQETLWIQQRGNIEISQTNAHTVRHKYSHHHLSSAPRPPALSSPAAITLSRHKKTVAKMNTISTSTLAWGGVRGNTSQTALTRQLPLSPMSPTLGQTKQHNSFFVRAASISGLMVLWLHNARIIFMRIMHGGKCFHLREGVSQWRCPPGRGDSPAKTGVCAWHKSHSIWAEGKQWQPQALCTGSSFPAMPELSIHLFYISPLVLLSVLTERVATKLKQHLLTMHTKLLKCSLDFVILFYHFT